MESGQAFSMTVVSFDRKRKTGGAIQHYPEAKFIQSIDELELVPGDIFGGGRDLTPKEEKQVKAVRDPHHRKWYTRNIRILQNGHPTAIKKKIHPPLIIEFNGQKVAP